MISSQLLNAQRNRERDRERDRDKDLDDDELSRPPKSRSSEVPLDTLQDPGKSRPSMGADGAIGIEGREPSGLTSASENLRKPSPKTLRGKIFVTFDDPEYSRLSFFVTNFIMLLIVLSTLTFCLQTLDSLSRTDAQDYVWFCIEATVIAVFTAEYLIRLLTCPNLRRFLLNLFNTIDLLAVLPFYIELIVQAATAADAGVAGLAVIRVIRLVRVLRLFKLGKNSPQLQMVTKAMARSREGILLLFFMLSLAMVFFASFIYFAETSECTLNEEGLWIYNEGTDLPGVPTKYQNIVVSFWWSLVTISTVGYGDMFPITGQGKLVGVATMICGLLVVAFPITIISANLGEVYDEEKLKREKIEAVKKAQNHAKELQEYATDQHTLEELLLEINLYKKDFDKDLNSFQKKFEILSESFNEVTSLIDKIEHVSALEKEKKPKQAPTISEEGEQAEALPNGEQHHAPKPEEERAGNEEPSPNE